MTKATVIALKSAKAAAGSTRSKWGNGVFRFEFFTPPKFLQKHINGPFGAAFFHKNILADAAADVAFFAGAANRFAIGQFAREFSHGGQGGAHASGRIRCFYDIQILAVAFYAGGVSRYMADTAGGMPISAAILPTVPQAMP